MELLAAPTGGRPIRGWQALSRLALALAFLFITWAPRPAEAAELPEYRLKAVFLYNFAQFVSWPPRAFPQAQAPLVIGILGDDPFGSDLDETVRGEQVNGRPLAVRRYRKVEDVSNCHILFVSRSEVERAGQIFASLKGREILTVGDAETPAMRGAMIRFAMEKNKVRLKINVEAAKAAQLTISSKLLRAADVVGP